jgi:serine phosphatase RsbU (regulator of sigma subunit)/integral membrane sensor domain MASE1
VRRQARPLLHLAGLFLLIATVYAGGAELSWHSLGAAGGRAAFFPPAGATVAAMLLARRSRWPAVGAAIVLCELTVDLSQGLAFPAALGFAGANLVEPVTGALVTLRLCRGRPDIRHRRDFLRFGAGACVAGPVAGGLIAATVITLTSGSGWAGNVVQWWAGDGVAVLAIGVPILLWPRRRELIAAKWPEFLALVLATVGGAVPVFLESWQPALILVPLVGWAAFRLGDIGVTVTVAIFALIANYMTAAGHGAFAAIGSSSAALTVTQVFIAVFMVVGLLTAQEVAARSEADLARQAERTERDRENARRVAAEVGAVIADAPSAATSADLAVRAVRDRLGADEVMINLLGSDQRSFSRLASTGLPASAAEIAEHFTAGSDAPGPLSVRLRQAVYRSDRQSDPGEFADKRDIESAAGLRAVAALPLMTEDGPQGYLDVWWSSPREFSFADRDFLEGLADTVSRCIERAKLRQAERRESQRLRTLSEVARLLSAALTPDDVAHVVATTVQVNAGARAVGLAVAGDDDATLEWVATSAYPAAFWEKLCGTNLRDSAVATDAVRTGRPATTRTISECERRYPGTGHLADEAGLQTLLSWPLSTGQRTFGALVLAWAREQPLDGSQLTFVTGLASLVAQALNRARRFTDEQAVAAILQQAVMPETLPPVPGLDVGAVYQPAAPEHGVGGDWYDVLPLPSGAVYVSVGDVVGHGLAAAQDMTQLRNSARALAVCGLPPTRLLSEINGIAGHVMNGKFATMSVGLLDPGTGRLCYGTAGHPPALIRNSGTGKVTYADEAAGPVLGVDDDPGFTQRNVILGPEDILLMYSDGLVERRGEDIETGLGRLARHLERWPATESLPGLCQHLTGACPGAPQYDDICVLAVRRSRIAAA